jgi:hypothetical protein
VPIVAADGPLVPLTSWRGGQHTQAQLIAGHALTLTLTSDPHAGRLVAAADHRDLGGVTHGVVLIYSDDAGQAWHQGADDAQSGAPRPDEASAVQLSDGRIYVSTRDQWGCARCRRENGGRPQSRDRA